MMKIWDKIGQFIVNILIFLITVLTIFILYSYINLELLNKDYVSILGCTYFEVASGSMSPAINKNDLVIVKLNSDYEVDDIVTYKLGNDFITHRVKKNNIKTIVTKGDANNASDKSISKESVIGKVVFVIPKFGIWKQVILTPKVFILLVMTFILFSFTFSYNTKDKRNKIKRQRDKKINKLSDTDLPILKKNS